MDLSGSVSPPTSSSTSTPGGRGGRHLKRLSLSVTPRELGSASPAASSPYTPERHSHSQYASSIASTSTAATSPFAAARESPLNRSFGPSGSGRRARPLSLYSSSSWSISSLDGAGSSSPSPLTRALPVRDEGTDQVSADDTSERQEGAFSPTSSLTSRSLGTPARSSELNSSLNGRRSILGRSAHTRRQSSISYARASPSPGSSAPSTPRHSLTPGSAAAPRHSAGHPDPDGPGAKDYFGASIEESAKSTSLDASEKENGSFEQQQRLDEAVASQKGSPYNEMNVGIGAKSADLLTFIAKKERKCMDLREELKRHEEELAVLKKKWETIIQREMLATTTAARESSSSPSQSGQNSANTSPSTSLHPASTSSVLPLPSPSGLFSSLTASLSASATSASSASTAASGKTTGTSALTPSPKPTSTANRRLLTSRHSISVSPSASRSSSSPTSYFGGAPLDTQDSPTDAVLDAHGNAAAYDVSKMAKSWLGGMMKSASTVLETLAPPPAGNTSGDQLGTVAEEEEPEEEDDHERDIGRRTSLATTLSTSTSSNSPSSSYDFDEEEARFSSGLGSRASSVSSISAGSESSKNGLHSSDESLDTVRSREAVRKESTEDTTPLSTPVLPQGPGADGASAATPKASTSAMSRQASTQSDTDDLWGLSEFEDPSARESREKLERERIDLVHTSPQRKRDVSPAPAVEQEKGKASASAKAGHGRRRSTAFELGGAWGSLMGKKWSEVANSETFRNSKRATLSFVDTFEKTIGDALSIDPNASPNSGSASPMHGCSPDLGSSSPSSRYVSSPATSPAQEKSLPSGIGGASAWSALLGSSTGQKKQATPKTRNDDWSVNSASSYNSTRIRHSPNLLDDDEASEAQDSLPAHVSPSHTLQASPAGYTKPRHSKRMSLPSNLLVGNPRSRTSAFGLGLEDVTEDDKAEAEDAWGW